MADINISLKITLEYEGGYSNNPNDPGGETNYGITKKTALNYGYDGDMHNIPMDLVTHIYKTGYWDTLNLDTIVNQNIANNIFDTAVNEGTRTSAKMAQSACNNSWPQVIEVDGNLGPLTIGIINMVKPNVFIYHFRELRITRYQELVTKDPKLKEFLHGWLKRAQLG